MKKVLEAVTDTIKNTSEGLTKTMMLTSKENSKAIENLNHKFQEITIYRGILPSCLISPLSKISKPKNNSQFKLVKYPNSNRANDLLINKA